MKGNVMNDDKLECLRLAIEYMKKTDDYIDIIQTAQAFYNWIYEHEKHEKPNSLTFEKISKERE